MTDKDLTDIAKGLVIGMAITGFLTLGLMIIAIYSIFNP